MYASLLVILALGGSGQQGYAPAPDMQDAIVTPGPEIAPFEQVTEAPGMPVGSCADCDDDCDDCDDDWDDDDCCEHHCCRSTCDMPLHQRYFPAHHGYYYFRPYNYAHIAQHQEIVQRWGGDPRNPYYHELFNKVYQELGVAGGTSY